MDDLRRIDLNLLLTLQALLAEKHPRRLAPQKPAGGEPRAGAAARHLPGSAADASRRHPDAARGSCSNRWKRRSDNSTRCCTRANSTPRWRCAAFASRCPTMRRTCCCRRCCAGCAPRPGIDLAISQASREACWRNWPTEIDLALGVFPDAPGDIKRETLFEHFVSAADRRSLPQGRACRRRNGWSAPTYWSRCGRRRKRDRRRAEGAGPAQACRPDAAALERVDGSAGRNRPDPDGCQPGPGERRPGKALRQFKPPFDLPSFSFQQAWHGRRDSDPALCWLRSVVISLCADCAASAAKKPCETGAAHAGGACTHHGRTNRSARRARSWPASPAAPPRRHPVDPTLACAPRVGSPKPRSFRLTPAASAGLCGMACVDHARARAQLGAVAVLDAHRARLDAVARSSASPITDPPGVTMRTLSPLRSPSRSPSWRLIDTVVRVHLAQPVHADRDRAHQVGLEGAEQEGPVLRADIPARTSRPSARRAGYQVGQPL